MFWDDEIFDEMEKMRRRLNQLTKRFLEPAMLSGRIGEELEGFESLPVDVNETEDELIVKAMLPGFDKADVAIKATENTLEISAQHREKRIEKTEKMFRVEKKFGALRRFLTLPCAVEYEKSKTDIDKGVLTIRLPKKIKKKVGKEITVK